MDLEGRQLKLISFTNAYENIDEANASEAFADVMRLRRTCHGSEYPEGGLPLDLADFVCLHHLLCLPIAGRLTAVAGFRQVTLAAVDKYDLEFPLIKVLKDAGADAHLGAVNEIIERHRQSGSSLMYSAGIAIRKDLIADKPFSLLFREVTAALAYDDFAVRSTSESLCLGAMRFKVHVWLQKMGYDPLLSGKVPFDPVPYTVKQHPFLLMHLKKPSAWARECHKRHHDLLANRIWVQAPAQKAKTAA